jgi:RNA polymerase sigma-70 factor (ECF subfamily)
MASGDREAFAALFRRHQATVYRFSRQMLGSKEPAEDVTQEVFIALARNASRFDPSIGSLTTYLYGVARNLILQRHKRDRAHLEVDIESIHGTTSKALAVDADPSDGLSRSQLSRQLRLAILKLPVHYREAVVLCELNGLSYEEAAGVAGCPVGTIRSRLSRARQMLIGRCRALLARHREEGRGQRDEGRGKRAEGRGMRAESERKWLTLTKNNC